MQSRVKREWVFFQSLHKLESCRCCFSFAKYHHASQAFLSKYESVGNDSLYGTPLNTVPLRERDTKSRVLWWRICQDLHQAEKATLRVTQIVASAVFQPPCALFHTRKGLRGNSAKVIFHPWLMLFSLVLRSFRIIQCHLVLFGKL